MADTPKQNPTPAAPSSEDLLKQIQDLQAQLAATTSALQQSEQAQADILRQLSSIPIAQEVHAGKAKKTVVDAKGSESEVEVDIYAMTINLPASAGMFIRINDFPLYNGQTYKLEMDTVRSVKEAMYRAWWHENNVAGDEREVAYRPQGTSKVTPFGVQRGGLR